MNLSLIHFILLSLINQINCPTELEWRNWRIPEWNVKAGEERPAHNPQTTNNSTYLLSFNWMLATMPHSIKKEGREMPIKERREVLRGSQPNSNSTLAQQHCRVEWNWSCWLPWLAAQLLLLGAPLASAIRSINWFHYHSINWLPPLPLRSLWLGPHSLLHFITGSLTSRCPSIVSLLIPLHFINHSTID